MKRIFFVTFVLVACAVGSSAQEALTAADYDRAVKMLNFNTSALVDRANFNPNFLPDGRFWYQALTPTGREYVLVDPKTGARKAAAKLADLGVSQPPAPAALSPEERRFMGISIPSPDGKMRAFIKDFNLWVRDEATKQTKQLTTDGVKNFGYATDNAGWKHSERAVLVWSPDSKKIATFQQDEREVSDVYLVPITVGAPKLDTWKSALPGDEHVPMLHRVVIDVDSSKVTKLQAAPDPHRSTVCDDISCDGGLDDVYWASDAKTLAFVSSTRDHKVAKLRVADAATGAVRDVYEESVKTQFESTPHGGGGANWRYLPASNEFIWYSERSDWAHLYLYDLATGKLKNQITTGEFPVWHIERVDEASRTIFFTGGPMDKTRDPYFTHFYRVDLDGKNLKLLTPENANHDISISPDGTYFTDSYSTPDTPAKTVVRDMNGSSMATVDQTDISRLTAAGWVPPVTFKVSSRNGRWPLYGLMFRPSNLDPTKKYPVINYIYPGPQGGGVGTRSFIAARGDHQALAELGFVVVVLDGTCNPLRSKSFHDVCYGNMADNTLEDQIAGLKQLAAKYTYMDLTRVGVWGHSGGGFATAAAMFRFPDFYKVGISESGNHDNRNYEDDWGERYIGLLSGDNYEKQANQMYAGNLKGKLLLAHGTMDDNVPPSNTYLVVDALIRANKDFDLIMIPNAKHGYGAASYYMMRRRWDYFVKNLLGAEPPKEYKVTPKQDPRMH